jgi:hypothetical protein
MSGTLSLLPEDQWLEVDGQRVPTQLAVLPWQAAGRSFTATGYGRRIPTTRRIQLPGSPRWRRVYVCIVSYAGTAYFEGPRDPATGRRAWIIAHSCGCY